jgi:hypothetical protein
MKAILFIIASFWTALRARSPFVHDVDLRHHLCTVRHQAPAFSRHRR